MIQRRPTLLSPRTFNEDVTNTLYALVYADGSGMPRFHSGVAEFFLNAYPKLFTCGVLGRNPLRDDRWWNTEFQTSVGPMRTDRRRGYYLFEGAWSSDTTTARPEVRQRRGATCPRTWKSASESMDSGERGYPRPTSTSRSS